MPIDIETCFEKVTHLEGRMDEHDKLYESIHRRFDSIDNRFVIVEDRLNHLDAKIDSFRADMDVKIDSKIEFLIKEINANQRSTFRLFTWVIGILLTSWLSILLTILYRS